MNKEKLQKLFSKTFNGTKKEYFEILKQNLLKEEKTFVVTANPEAFTIATQDDDYMKMLSSQETSIVPDGIGLIKAGNILNYNFKERIPGVDIADELLKLANQYEKEVYLFGAKKEVLEQLKEKIKNQYPNLVLVGKQNGYVSNKNLVFKDIIKKEPDIVLVALGMPLQEKLIYQNLNKFKKGIFVGVGGSFDVLSGTIKRAPQLFIKLNLEWLYRIIKEPKRLKRFYNNNVKFILKVKKIANKNNF